MPSLSSLHSPTAASAHILVVAAIKTPQHVLHVSFLPSEHQLIQRFYVDAGDAAL